MPSIEVTLIINKILYSVYLGWLIDKLTAYNFSPKRQKTDNQPIKGSRLKHQSIQSNSTE